MIKFPYSKPEITNEDIEIVTDTLKTGYLTQGNNLLELEKQLSISFGSKNVLACNSGTAALHLVYNELGLDENNGLLTSSITFLATANAAKMCGAPVIFADVDPQTGLMTAETIEQAILNSKIKIRVITVVHLGGRTCDMKAIEKIAKKYGCFLVEDACHAPGAYIGDISQGMKVGGCQYSIACTFSFHAIKHITMGEGGCISTNNNKLFEAVKLNRSHGITRDPKLLKNMPEKKALWYYEMKNLGWNYRADEISCALGLSQLKRLDINIEKRRNLVKIYNNQLKNNLYITTPKEPLNIKNHVWHLYSITVDFKKIDKTRGEIMSSLSDIGIGTQVHYIPLFLQPYYRIKFTDNFIGALKYYKGTLSIPLYPDLSETDVKYISEKLNNIIS